MAWTTRCTTAAAATVGVALLLTGCGSDGGGTSAGGAAEAPPALTATVPSSPGSGSSSSTLPGAPEGGVPGAIDVRDPQGTYTMQISPAWLDASGTFVQEVEAWYVSPPDGVFRNNVNVLTQDTQGMDLQQYIDYSAAHLGGLELVSATIVPGAFGGEIGLMDYQGTIAGAPVPLHALATVAVEDGVAVVATLTATLDTFAVERVVNEPYLLTLRRTVSTSPGTGGGGSGLGTA